MKLSEAVSGVSALANEVREYYERELPKWHPNYPLVGPDEEDPPPPPEEIELRDFLKTLSADEIRRLLMVMYLGRGDIGTGDLAGCYEEWRAAPGGARWAAAQLLDNPSLADLLSDGLEELSKHGLNVDELPLRRGKARKR